MRQDFVDEMFVCDETQNTKRLLKSQKRQVKTKLRETMQYKNIQYSKR